VGALLNCKPSSTRIAKKCRQIQHQEDSEVQGRMDGEFSIKHLVVSP
jgi:hypothetical protein